MSRVNVDIIAYTDPRFVQLAKLLGLADHDHARSKVEYLWLECTLRGTTELPVWLVEAKLGDGAAEALVECELARYTSGRGDSKTRLMHISGARERCLWLAEKQGQSSKGGKARASSASRAGGRFTSREPAIAGETPPAQTSPLTPALSPAPAPALAPTDQNKNPLKPPKGGGSRRSKSPFECTPAERESALRVLARLGERNGIAYRGEEHVRIVVARMREGISELELRAVVSYCAYDLGWVDKPNMVGYLRPSTLFGPQKIHDYLDAARSKYAADIAKAQREQQEAPLQLVPEVA